MYSIPSSVRFVKSELKCFPLTFQVCEFQHKASARPQLLAARDSLFPIGDTGTTPDYQSQSFHDEKGSKNSLSANMAVDSMGAMQSSREIFLDVTTNGRHHRDGKESNGERMHIFSPADDTSF